MDTAQAKPSLVLRHVTTLEHSSNCAINDHTFPDLTAIWPDCDCGAAFGALIDAVEAAHGLSQALVLNGFGATSDRALPGEYDTLADKLSALSQGAQAPVLNTPHD